MRALPFTLMAMLLGLAVVLSVAGPAPQTPTDPPDETAKAKAKSSQEIPQTAKLRRNPVQPGEESLARGQRLFSSQCAMCHGAGGKGDGAVAGPMAIKMPDLTDSAFQKRWTDGELFYIVTNGHDNMPADSRLKEEWRWDMINFVRTLDR